MRAALFAVALAATLAAVGCDDPARDKAKAVTAAPTSTQAIATTGGEAAKGSVKQTFDQGTSKIAWVGSKVTGKHDGGFSTFKGTVDVVDGEAERSKVEVEIDAASITSDTEKLTAHLKSADFFDVAKHPKATFASTSIKKGGDKGASHTVTGELTIKGVAKSVTFPATIQASADQSSVDAEFAINRRDFSLNYAGMPNDLIRDDVVIRLTIRAKKPTS